MRQYPAGDLAVLLEQAVADTQQAGFRPQRLASNGEQATQPNRLKQDGASCRDPTGRQSTPLNWLIACCRRIVELASHVIAPLA
jgi:hypothetical protein